MITTVVQTAAEGIARETAMLQSGRPAMVLWRASEPAVVLPEALTRRAAFAAAAKNAEDHGWIVTTRRSGGGLVPQGPDTLNLALVLPCPDRFTTDDGYRFICGAITEALSRFDITSTTGARKNAFCDGAWNVLVQNRKLAGTAQRWRATPQGRVALIHAAILTQTPKSELWPILQDLHKRVLPSEPLPQANAHIALDQVLPSMMHFSKFPGALARAVEDRLRLYARRKEDMV